MRELAMIRHTLQVIVEFDASIPLHRQLASYFKSNKAMGSRDRREVRALTYPWFRIGKTLLDIDQEERLAVANFLCNSEANSTAVFLLERYNLPVNGLAQPVSEKLALVEKEYPAFDRRAIFPMHNSISKDILLDELVYSMLQQPLVWIRVREAHVLAVKSELQVTGIAFTVHPNRPLSWSFDPAVKLTEMESYLKGYFEIQDLSSQIAGDAFNPESGQQWWDACAASGGKSLQLLDKGKNIQLLASDVRASILENYRQRLQRAGYSPSTRVIDLSSKEDSLDQQFDAIIADVPCSGSGTWSRTPENSVTFAEETLTNRYLPLQRTILDAICERLKPGGTLYFITCSVFYAENEENVKRLVQTKSLSLVRNLYLKGMDQRADSMFLAVLVKN